VERWGNTGARRARRVRRAAFLTASLLAGLGLVSTPARAIVPARRSTPATSLPPAPSDDPRPPAAAAPSGDFVNAPLGDPATQTASGGSVRLRKKGAGFDEAKSTEIAALTSATRKIFANPDGTRTAKLSSGPVRFLREGAWVEIDNAPVADVSGLLRPKASPLATAVKATAVGDLVVVGDGASRVVIAHPDAQDVAATITGGEIEFPGGLGDGRNLRLRFLTDGVEESVVLPSTSAPNSYRTTVTLPIGWSARNAAPSIEVLDATGAVVAGFGGGFAHDATVRAETPVRSQVVSRAANVYTIEVSIDPAWLADAARVAPVTIDPTYYSNTATGAGSYDTYMAEGENSGHLGEVRVGTYSASGHPINRSFFKFDTTGLVRSDQDVFASWFDINNFYSFSCNDRGVSLYGLGGPFVEDTLYQNQPGLDGHGPYDGFAFADGYSAACPGSWEEFDTFELADRWFRGVEPNYGLSLRADNENDQYSWKKFYSSHAGSNAAPALYVTYNTPPDIAQPVSPADAVTATNTTPTLSVNPAGDPNGDGVQYYFRIASGADGESGALVDSGWIGSTSWTPPVGALQDGATYYWHVWTYDGTDARKPDWQRKLTINQRLGTSGPSPMDTAGPITVNLATGNAAFDIASPSFKTVGGSIGLSYSYNSLAVSRNQNGLSGQYFVDSGDHSFSGSDPLALTRLDPQVQFNWGLGSPSPAIAGDGFLARWNGFVTIPTGSQYNGAYYFGAAHDDGVRIWINNTLVFDRWGVLAEGLVYGSPISLSGGQTVPIRIEYMENGGGASVNTYVSGPGFSNYALPASWLTPSDSVLPVGWSLSAAGVGPSSYSLARIAEASVTLYDAEGGAHNYAWTGAAWAPPTGESGVLTKLADGGVQLKDEDGQTYTFGPDGSLMKLTSSLDDRNPAAAAYTWTGSPARLTQITDPVSGRSINLDYQGRSTCPSASGYTTPPDGMLCQARYWDNTSTQIFYLGPRLSRIVDPGGEVQDFGYWSDGRVKYIRDPLAGDAVAAGIRVNDISTFTGIAYNGEKVDAVTSPAPTAGAPAAQHYYRYNSATQTDVHVVGQEEPSGFARRVGFDSGARLTTDTNTANLTSTTAWDSNDNPTETTDPAGIKSTTVYDVLSRPTDQYGPAAASCFTGQLPNGSCSVAHATTAYDEGYRGLAAAYWTNSSLSGSPTAHALGVGTGDGSLSVDWGTGGPANVPTDAFSGRFTGSVYFPSAGTYTFRLYADDGVRLVVDDIQRLDSWAYQAGNRDSTSMTVGSPGWHRVRLDYNDIGGPGSLTLAWVLPGGGQQTIPGAYLRPDFGLVTSVTDADGKTSRTEFSAPEFGLATASVADPSGLNLRTTTSYEAPNAGFLRRITKTMPTATSSPSAYAPTVTADSPAVYWRLGETSGQGAQDSSGNFRTGVYTGTIGLGVPGTTGDGNTAVSLNGGYITSGYLQNNVTAYTDEAWVKTTDAGLTRAVIQDRGPTPGNGKSLTLSIGGVPGGGGVPGDVSFGVDGDGTFIGRYTSATVNDGQWHHLVGTWSAPSGTAVGPGQFAIYIDGVPVSSTAVTIGSATSPLTGAGGTRVGQSEAWGSVLNGSVDDVAVYPTALSAARVAAHFANSTAVTTGPVTTYAYYGAAEARTNPCNGSQSANQAGALKTTTGPDPDGIGPQAARVEEVVYDAIGGAVASRIGSDAWTCVTYDGRGRVVTTAIPAFGGSSARTITRSYAVGGNPLVTSMSDATGTTTTAVDLVGRVTSYADEGGMVTRTVYDQAGRPTATYRTLPGQPETQLAGFGYANGRPDTQTDYSSASPRTISYGYDAAGRPTTTTRPNGLTTTAGFDATGRLASVSNKVGGTEVSPWSYTRNPSGTIATETGNGRTRAFTYDGAGRLTRTVQGSTTRQYSFDADGNRCSTTAACDGSYSYDAADKLLTSPQASSYTYDSHGNLTNATRLVSTLPLNQSVPFDASMPNAVRTIPVTVGSNGTLNASMDWANAPINQNVAAAAATVNAASAKDAGTVFAYGESVLGASLGWSKGIHRPTSTTAWTVPAGSYITKSITTDATGDLNAVLDYGPSYPTKTVTGTPANLNGAPSDTPITLSSNGHVHAAISWSNAAANLDIKLLDQNGATVAQATSTNSSSETLDVDITAFPAYPVEWRTYTLRVFAPLVGAKYTGSVSYPITPSVTFELTNAGQFGSVIATGTQHPSLRKLTINAAALPAGSYVLRAISDASSASTLTETHSQADYASLNISLRDPAGNTVLNYAAVHPEGWLYWKTTNTGGPYTWVLTNNSPDIPAPYTFGTWATTLTDETKPSTAVPLTGSTSWTITADGSGKVLSTLTWQKYLGSFPNLKYELLNGAQVLATATGNTGVLPINGDVPSAGTYTLRVTPVTTGGGSFTALTSVPKQHTGSAALSLSGPVTAQATPGARPQTLSVAVTPGNYNLVVTPTGTGVATITGGYPGPIPTEAISYDGRDLATRIDDGQTVTTDTLGPSGRVIRHVVTNTVGGATVEDTTYGYDNDGDSPAVMRPTAGGAVTTYVAGGAGVLLIDTGGTATYPVPNGHGDIVGVVDAAGTYTAYADADEYGNSLGGAPAGRLGWLGEKERFYTGGRLDVMRMGVRLYDPGVGRFLQVDPVEGGCSNDYAYVFGDPINATDLSGSRSSKCNHSVRKRGGKLTLFNGPTWRTYGRVGRPVTIEKYHFFWFGDDLVTTKYQVRIQETTWSCGGRIYYARRRVRIGRVSHSWNIGRPSPSPDISYSYFEQEGDVEIRSTPAPSGPAFVSSRY